MVKWSEPVILAPLKGLVVPNSYLHDNNPGISTSANSISFLPHYHKLISLTTDSG